MADNPDKLARLWQELKRRKVIYVITVYASAAFVIIELVNNVVEPLNLPERIPTIAIIVLAIGFPIVVILSWIFDLTPKGMERTKPLSEVQEAERPVIQNRWKIATYASIAVIVGLIVLNIFNLNKVSASLTQYGKSIAVLPFINDTPDEENIYFINGAMESVLNNLSTIKDLKVLPRRSVEQYRDKILPIPEIAAAQKVSYVLEGSMQKYGEQISITLRLIDQNDLQLWSRQFDREIQQAEEYFAFWSEIAQLIAEELKVVISPEEKQRIEKIPTTSLTAQTYYQRGYDIFVEYYLEKEPKDTNKLNTAEHFFRQALEYDSTCAPAYVYLAWVVLNSPWRYNSPQVKLDSMLSLGNKALSYDDQLSEAYGIRGLYYHFQGEPEKALYEYNTALKFNPNDWFALRQKAMFYYLTDIPKALECIHRAIWSNTGATADIGSLLDRLVTAYQIAGFLEKAEYYIQESFKYTMDTSAYYAGLSTLEFFRCNWDKVIEYCNKRLELNSTDMDALFNKGAAYLLLKEYKESLGFFEKLIDLMNASGYTIYISMKWISYAYRKNGEMKLAEFYLEKELERWNSLIEQRRNPGLLLQRAMVFAYRGMKEEALTDLRELYDLQANQDYKNISMMTDWPFFDNIRDDPEFQKILTDMKAKYQAEHEKVRKWLEENNML